jgi:hypothetical protein
MALYLISYDVPERDKDEYKELWNALARIKAVKVLYSDWLVVADVGKSQEIYDAVASKMRLNDKVLVQEVTSDATWDKLLVSDEEFLDLLEQAR